MDLRKQKEATAANLPSSYLLPHQQPAVQPERVPPAAAATSSTIGLPTSSISPATDGDAAAPAPSKLPTGYASRGGRVSGTSSTSDAA